MGETSRLVSLYTRKFGKVKVVAKGARRPKSKFGAGLDPITEIIALFYHRENRDLHTLSDCDIIRPFSGIKSHVERLSYASALCELTDHLSPGEGPNLALYRAMDEALCGLESVPEGEAEKFLWYFQIRAADALGYRPELIRCVSCRKTVGAGQIKFSPVSGGIVCERCSAANLTGLEVALGTLRFLEKLRTTNFEKVHNLKVAPLLRSEAQLVLRTFLEYHTEDYRKLRSLKFLESITANRRTGMV